MKPNTTDITFVLDRSGSMSTIADDVRGGFDSFVDEQRKGAGEAHMTLIQFDDQYEINYERTPIGDTPKLDFVPRGMTALLDAVGKAITSAGERLGAMDEEERPEIVLFVIMTDGHENSSREYTAKQINDKINHQQDKYNWQFVFLGANQDAITVADGMGIKGANAINYAATSDGATSVLRATSANVSSMRATGDAKSLSYSDSQRSESMRK